MEKSRIIKKIAQRSETQHPGKDHQVTWNETKHIKIPQIQYTDKIVDASVAMQRQFLRFKPCTERVGEGDPISEFGLDIRYGERAC